MSLLRRIFGGVEDHLISTVRIEQINSIWAISMQDVRRNTSQFICLPANNGLSLLNSKCAEDVGFDFDFIQLRGRQSALA